MTKRIIVACTLLAALAGCKPTLEFKSDKSTIPQGGEATLEWEVDFAKGSSSRDVEVTKVGDGLEEEGSAKVLPRKTTKYELKAKANVYGFPVVAKETVTITVSTDAYSWDLNNTDDSAVWEGSVIQPSNVEEVRITPSVGLPSNISSTNIATEISVPKVEDGGQIFAFLETEAPDYISLDDDKKYEISYEVILATNINKACTEENSSKKPITSYLKVGVLRTEPGTSNGSTTLELDTSTGIDPATGNDKNEHTIVEDFDGTGEISSGNGTTIVNLGKIEYTDSDAECDSGNPAYKSKTFTQSTPFTIKTDEDGKLWLMVGIHTLAEEETDYYIMNITINIEEQ